MMVVESSLKICIGPAVNIHSFLDLPPKDWALYDAFGVFRTSLPQKLWALSIHNVRT
jgi:hypothetical protein